jgi:hypothetical protein
MSNKKRHWAEYRIAFFLTGISRPLMFQVREYNRFRAERNGIKQFLESGHPTETVSRISTGRLYEIKA